MINVFLCVCADLDEIMLMGNNIAGKAVLGEDDFLLLECFVAENAYGPLANIEYRIMLNDTVLSNKHVYNISRVSRNDSGIYQCSVNVIYENITLARNSTLNVVIQCK